MSAPERELSAGRDHRLGALMYSLDDLGAVDAAEVPGGDREIGVPKLSLDHDQRDPLSRHLHCVCVPQLVGRESAPHPGR